ncbi:MAG TPA: ABC transporter permease [Gammaproteobacteria bacterium]|nr:ABC transporter permease [Gammaproteobacteria bacterium]
MFLLAWRQVLLDPLRTVLTAVALGSVIAVILILVGFEQGQYYQLKQIVLNRKADLIVTQAGVSNFIAVRSSIPQLARAEVEAVKGVINAHPVTAIPVIYNRNNVRTPVYVLVYDTWGGPSSIIQGREITSGKEIVIDASLAKKYGINPGDSFYVTDFEFKVVGITQEAAFMMPFAFINYDGMLDLFIESEIAPDLSTFPLLSYMLVELDPAADRQSVARQIELHVPSVDVITPGQLAQNDVNMGKVFFKPIMGLLVSIGYIIGMLVVGLIMYADIRARIKSFAVLKALGFSFGRLFLVVLIQSSLLLVITIPIGTLLALGVSVFIETMSPAYFIRLFDPVIFLQTLMTFFVFAVIGALIPVRTIQRTDPMLAFQDI